MESISRLVHLLTYRLMQSIVTRSTFQPREISSLLRSPNNSRDLYLSRNYRVTLVAVQLDLSQKDSTAPNEFREFFSYPMLFLGITGRNTVHELVSNRPSILCLDLEVAQNNSSNSLNMIDFSVTKKIRGLKLLL
ncbi:hypothetical protein TNCV_2357601 [Trichonephila clavipes]|nr:hypothetical protein TNCV_2357601 [Trichonephila clavipes]